MEHFHPTFCPYASCACHSATLDEPYTEYIDWGAYYTKAFGWVSRFRCKRCGRTFSVQTFSVDYYAKRVIDYDDLLQRLSSCESLSALGRSIGLSCESVSNRISRASRQALAADSLLASFRKPDEDLASDGFESFCVSQFFPNNIHLLTGCGSQFVYAANHVTLRRKGRMTEAQKRWRSALDRRFRPDRWGIELAFARIGIEALRVLSDSGRAHIDLWTDEKLEYRRALSSSPCFIGLHKVGRIEHRRVSSRAARTKYNPLFAVNYLDRELRKDLHEHVRETVCFGRNVNHQMERLELYLFGHNFRKPYRVHGDQRTHAELAGYEVAQIAKVMRGIWRDRAFLSRTELGEDRQASWLRLRTTPLKEGAQYLPAYAAA